MTDHGRYDKEEQNSRKSRTRDKDIKLWLWLLVHSFDEGEGEGVSGKNSWGDTVSPRISGGSMKLKLYMNLRDIAGKDELEMDLERPVSLAELLRELSTMYGEKMRKFLLKDTNEIADSLIITMNDEVVRKHESVFITNKDEVSILLPLAGG